VNTPTCWGESGGFVSEQCYGDRWLDTEERGWGAVLVAGDSSRRKVDTTGGEDSYTNWQSCTSAEERSWTLTEGWRGKMEGISRNVGEWIGETMSGSHTDRPVAQSSHDSVADAQKLFGIWKLSGPKFIAVGGKWGGRESKPIQLLSHVHWIFVSQNWRKERVVPNIKTYISFSCVRAQLV
jgi:hypothetical protein